ncbi:hypothetical protein BGX28_005652 [Mortierella sp. GBA30]|nr:hypothetical protein BGX28_005652 [Mortierella sp. GBA30]
MRITTTLVTTAAIAFAALASSLVQSSPVPHQAQDLTTQTLDKILGVYNDWDCKPSSQHPRPVVLVHGWTFNALDNWAVMVPQFKNYGYCVFALSYGQLNEIPFVYGLDKMENSAQQLSDFVDEVLNKTGSTQVDMLGYSEGTIMPQYYMKRLNGAAKVPSKMDEGVTPYTNGFFKRTYPNVHQQVLQAWCQLDVFEHLTMVADPLVFNGVHAFFSSSVQQMSCEDLVPRIL